MIAARLGASAKTAAFHVADLPAKLGTANRTEAPRVAYVHGLLVAWPISGMVSLTKEAAR